MRLDPKAVSAIRSGCSRKWVVTFSRRTDVGCHHEWFWDKLQRGGAWYPNPRNSKQICYCPLGPDRVHMLQPWTKDPVVLAPWIPKYQAMGFKVSVFCTVTGYPRFIEPKVPSADDAVQALRRIHADHGVAVKWRYDPVFLAEGLDSAWHLENFRRLAEGLSGTVTEAVTSFVQIDGFYGEIKAHFTGHLARHGMPYRPAGQAEMEDLLVRLTEIAKGCGISLGVCCYPNVSPAGLARGIRQAGCVSMSFLRQTCRFLEELPLKPTRKNCLCRESRDPGANNLCRHECIYCYANRWAAMKPSEVAIPPDAPWLSADPLPEGYPYPVDDEVLASL